MSVAATAHMQTESLNAALRLDGKTAIVTGCSTGIGRAISLAFADAGAKVAGVFNRTPAIDTAEAISAMGRTFAGIRADLRRHDAIGRVLAEVCGRFGRVDIVVNNAGVIRRNRILDFSESDWDDVFAVNTRALFFMCQAAARQFVDQGSGGKIINLASAFALRSELLAPSYGASKAGVVSITRSLANELAGKNINVNAIAPGFIRTEFTRTQWDGETRAGSVLETIPAGRWGEPEDVAGAALFLASPLANYIHGACLLVDGGWMTK